MSDSRYKVPSFESNLNRIIGFIFYYRLGFVILSMIIAFILTYIVYRDALEPDKLRNAALVLTGVSIIVGIFYSIINYEHNQIKFRHDVKTSRDLLSFTTACEWHKPPIVNYAAAMKQFPVKFNKAKISVEDFYSHLEDPANLEDKIAFFAVMNYFESIALGVKQEIMDEGFVKGFFGSLFTELNMEYAAYIQHRRIQRKNMKIWDNFTYLADSWTNN